MLGSVAGDTRAPDPAVTPPEQAICKMAPVRQSDSMQPITREVVFLNDAVAGTWTL